MSFKLANTFKDRQDAGNKLAISLKRFRGKSDGLVVTIPRGGIEVAYQISKALSLPLDIVTPRKIGCPGNKELAIGAVAENGEGYLNKDLIDDLNISENYIHNEMEVQRKESNRRQKIYRCHRNSPPEFKNKTIILVDDGIATGSTMKAAIESIRVKEPREIIVAVPVAAEDSIEEISKMKGVTQVECLLVPPAFGAVGCFYDTFDQVEDETVLSLMSDQSLIQKPQN